MVMVAREPSLCDKPRSLFESTQFSQHDLLLSESECVFKSFTAAVYYNVVIKWNSFVNIRLFGRVREILVFIA